MCAERVDEIVTFLKEIEKFKNVERRTFNSSGRLESDAEHAWHVAMFVVLFDREIPSGLSRLRMIKLALVHDLVEIYANDTFAFDEAGKATKREREKDASSRLFSMLPDDIRDEFFALFNEYEDKKTPEAKFVDSFDKIQPILQNLCSGGRSWVENDVKYSDIDAYKRKHVVHDDFVLGLYERLVDEGREKKLI